MQTVYVINEFCELQTEKKSHADAQNGSHCQRAPIYTARRNKA